VEISKKSQTSRGNLKKPQRRKENSKPIASITDRLNKQATQKTFIERRNKNFQLVGPSGPKVIVNSV